MKQSKTPKTPKTLADIKQVSVPEGYFAQDPTVHVPENHIYDIQDIKLTPLGALVYIGNAPYPHKGIPVGEAVGQLNTLKEYTKQKLYSFPTPNSFVRDFNVFFSKCFYSYRVNLKSMCPAARNLSYVINDILTELGISTPTERLLFSYNLSHVFEFDDAYRYRIQDIATMINAISLYKNPRKELKRVFDIAVSREVHTPQKAKMRKIYNLILLAMYIPKVKRAIAAVVPFYLNLIRLDKGDAYWAGFKDNYNFQGITHETHKACNPIPNMWTIDSNN